MPDLMSLFELARVGNFCFNLLEPVITIVFILSSQGIFQIILYALFLRFPWSILLPFPSYLNFHNLYLGVDVLTDDMTIPSQTDFAPVNLDKKRSPYFKKTSVDTLSTSLTPHTSSWSFQLPHTTSPHSRQYVPPPHYFPTNIPLNFWNFYALPIIVLTTSDTPP